MGKGTFSLLQGKGGGVWWGAGGTAGLRAGNWGHHHTRAFLCGRLFLVTSAVTWAHSFMLLPIAAIHYHSFQWIPFSLHFLREYTSLSIPLLVDIWVLSNCRLFIIMLLHTFLYISFNSYEHIWEGISLGVELLGYRVCVFSILADIASFTK